MKKTKNLIPFMVAAMIAASSLVGYCAPQAVVSSSLDSQSTYLYPPVTGISVDDTLGSKHEKATQELISMVNHNPELKALLEKSIAQAKKINPDKVTNPAQTLEEYYSYVDWASKALPWNVLHLNLPTSSLYEHIDQSIDYLYFINDQPLEELKDRGYYNNSIQYMEPYRSWLISFTTQWGAFLNTAASWNDTYYKIALSDERFSLNDDTYENPENWKTFNQFFARYLSSPDKRPIDSPEDDAVIVAPADSQPQGVWSIDKASNIVHEDGVNIKSGIFTSIETLLGNSAYKNAFAGGTLTHTFLDINDYHRYHFPVSGVIKEVTMIPADDAVGGTIIWDKKLNKYTLLAGTPGWQNIETRGCVIIETKNYGLVAVLPVGMSQISSVNFEDTVKVGAEVKKGDMLGCFLFGGSDIVMLFQKGVDFEITAQKASSNSYKHINMGNAYGVLNNKIGRS